MKQGCIVKREEEKMKETLQPSDKVGKKKQELILQPTEPMFSLDDIILPKNVREQILEVADYAYNSKIIFEQWGLGKTHKYSKRMGINLYGPSGTGKTMTAHAIAKYLGREILCVNYAEIESKYVGETPKNIYRAFEAAEQTHSILFFDEADAILSRRVTNMSNATDVSVNQTRSVLLTILNTYQDFIIFATNFIENFDPAFLRRISYHIRFELPDYDCRYRLWAHYIPAEMPNDFNLQMLSKIYENISGSDIANAVLMAAFKAARHKDTIVRQKYVEEAIQNVIASKEANAKRKPVVTKRIVSKEYVDKQLENA